MQQKSEMSVETVAEQFAAALQKDDLERAERAGGNAGPFFFVR